MTKKLHLKIFSFLFLNILVRADIVFAASYAAEPSLRAGSWDALSDPQKPHYMATRFLVIKAPGKGSIRRALRSNQFSAQKKVADAIKTAREDGYTVVLLFSAVNSHGFQGIANATRVGPIEADKKRALVYLERLTGCGHLDFSEISGLVNRLSSRNVAVTEARDGEEISYEEGLYIYDRFIEPSLLDLRDRKPIILQHACSSCNGEITCTSAAPSSIQYFPCQHIICSRCIGAFEASNCLWQAESCCCPLSLYEGTIPDQC